MSERLLLVLLAGTAGILIGLFGPGIFPAVQQTRDAEQAWLNPPTQEPAPTPFVLSVTRPAVGQTAVVPTLEPPPVPPTATPEPPPAVRSFVIALKGGGEMTVVATDHAAAINNVKSTGAEPDGE